MNTVTPVPGSLAVAPIGWQAVVSTYTVTWRLLRLPVPAGLSRTALSGQVRYSSRLAVMSLAAVCTLLIGARVLAASQWPWSAPQASLQQPHPAVVRLNVEEADGVALGSGTLVDVRDKFGLVITNWHVVRSATGAITVVFPDGFRSAARVLRMDRAWDLAALLIWRPHAMPVSIATEAPRPGDPLMIAGYGPGHYRTATGRCTQYLAPSEHHPFEMVELTAAARQGDSGGPIFNASGELAGVLFGSAGGTTSGSYAGRVDQFLASVWPPSAASESMQAIAAADGENLPPHGLQRLPDTDANATADLSPTSPMKPLPEISSDGALARGNSQAGSAHQQDLARVKAPKAKSTSLTWRDVAGDSLFQQCKTFLSILGLITLLVYVARVVAPSDAEST